MLCFSDVHTRKTRLHETQTGQLYGWCCLLRGTFVISVTPWWVQDTRPISYLGRYNPELPANLEECW